MIEVGIGLLLYEACLDYAEFEARNRKHRILNIVNTV